MNLSPIRNVTQNSVKRMSVLAAVLAASALAAQAQVVFSKPTDLYNSASQFAPTMITGPQGDIYLAWVAASNSQCCFIFFSRSSDGGATFSQPIQVSNESGSPVAAIDSAGNIYIAWVPPGSFGGTGGIHISRSSDGGATFSLPVAVTTTFASNPQLAVDPSGTVGIVWVTITGSHTVIPCPSDCPPVTTFDHAALFSKSTDAGSTFSSPTTVFSTHGDSANQGPTAQIAMPSSGQAYVLAQGAGSVSLARSSDAGASFLMTTIGSASSFEQPRMALDAAGNIDVVWVARSGRDHTFFSRSADQGATFSSPMDITPSSPGVSGPKIVVDPSGNIYLAWFETEDNFNPQGTVFFSRSTDAGITFAAPQALSTDPSRFTAFAAEWGGITVDSSGRIGVTWEDKTPANEWEIFFRRSSDLGATFDAPGSVSGPGASGSFSLAPAMATGPNSSICVAWMHTDQWPGPFHLFFSRNVELASVAVSPAGVTGGSSSTGTVTLSGPAPAGGAVVALSSSNTSAATVPSSVTVAAGFSNATFTVSTSRALCPKSATITASFNALSQTANVGVMPFVNLPPQACSAIGAHGPTSVGKR